MSSILKALEKVEESLRPGRSPGMGGFVAARVRRPAWVVPAGVLGGAAVAALATFAAMGGFSRHAAPAPEARSVAAVAPAVPSRPVPVEGRVVVHRKSSPQSPPGRAAAGPKAVTPPGAKAEAAPARSIPSSSPHPVAASTSPPPGSPVGETPAPAAGQLGPPLKVTGIAWQKDGEPSAAIVNDRPVQQGAVVDGFKVEEIFQDRVRFSGASGSLDVPLGGGE